MWVLCLHRCLSAGKGSVRREQNSLSFINKFNTTHVELARSANWELTPRPNWRPFLQIVSTQLLATLTDEWGNHSPARLSSPPRLSVYTTWLQTRVLFLPPSEHLQSLLFLVHWLHLLFETQILSRHPFLQPPLWWHLATIPCMLRSLWNHFTTLQLFPRREKG